jgi:hypothetical protein
LKDQTELVFQAVKDQLILVFHFEEDQPDFVYLKVYETVTEYQLSLVKRRKTIPVLQAGL